MPNSLVLLGDFDRLSIARVWAEWFHLRRVPTGKREVTFDLPKCRAQRTLSNAIPDVNMFLSVWRDKVEKRWSETRRGNRRLKRSMASTGRRDERTAVWSRYCRLIIDVCCLRLGTRASLERYTSSRYAMSSRGRKFLEFGTQNSCACSISQCSWR